MVDTPVWWTDADQAELDLIGNDLFECAYQHHMNCDNCAANLGGVCEALRDAYQAVEDWKARRSLYSKATYYRLEEIAHIAVRGRHQTEGASCDAEQPYGQHYSQYSPQGPPPESL